WGVGQKGFAECGAMCRLPPADARREHEGSTSDLVDVAHVATFEDGQMHDETRRRMQVVQDGVGCSVQTVVVPRQRAPFEGCASEGVGLAALAHPAVLDELCEQAVGGRAWETRASRELGEGEPIAGVELVQ